MNRDLEGHRYQPLLPDDLEGLRSVSSFDPTSLTLRLQGYDGLLHEYGNKKAQDIYYAVFLKATSAKNNRYQSVISTKNSMRNIQTIVSSNLDWVVVTLFSSSSKPKGSWDADYHLTYEIYPGLWSHTIPGRVPEELCDSVVYPGDIVVKKMRR